MKTMPLKGTSVIFIVLLMYCYSIPHVVCDGPYEDSNDIYLSVDVLLFHSTYCMRW